MAELAGLPVVVGLYATMLPLVGYALFGSSRQLVVGPEGALAALDCRDHRAARGR